MTYHAKVISGGKVVIPVDIRRELGIRDGDTLVVDRTEDGGVRMMTFQQVVRDSQEKARAIFGADYSVDAFLQERRTDWGEE
ncbi:MAG: AbrB/MazE/SpoVT family DNA-binding domain-containing protein [Sphingomonas sp.]